MTLLSQHVFTRKDLALSEALKTVPVDAKLNWTSGSSDEEIKFDFAHDSMRFQLWIDILPLDPTNICLKNDNSITQNPIWDKEKGFHFDFV